MKKTAIILILCMSIILLCSCNSKDDSSSSAEMKIIDENLRLKNKIAQLEEEIHKRDMHKRTEQEMEKLVLDFFYYINVGNTVEAQKRTTEQIKVTETLLVLPNNESINLEKIDLLGMQKVYTEWKGKEKTCMTFELRNTNYDMKMNVYFVQDHDKWKINNFRMNYTS